MKKILMENKILLLFSSVLILLPQVVAALLGEHIYYLPLQCLVLHWICLLITFYDWRKKPQEKKITQLVLWIMPVISMTGSAFILLVKSGQVSYTLAPYFMNVGFGLMFIVLGSFLPKIRRNRTMGIKVKWALENDDNWNATHRFGGKVWMGCGFVCLLCALFPFSGPGTGLFVAAVFAAALAPTVYSWLYYRKQLQNGEVVRIRSSKKGALVAVLFIAATVVFVVWVLFSGDMVIHFQENGFTVEASGWRDYTVQYADIESVTYEPEGVSDGESDRRTNGFGNLKMSMGHFYNDRFGNYIRYTFHDCAACVVLQTQGGIVVLNGEDEASTEEMYQTLQERIR